MGSPTFSPDGELLAYVARRPKSKGRRFAHDPLGYERTDVWLVQVRGGKARNLTNGEGTNTGFWSPSWSPDGRRLAMLSATEGKTRLLVWERSSGKLGVVTDLTVDLFPNFIWLSNEDLLCPVLPEGTKPMWLTAEMQAAETAVKEWQKAARGQEATASVLNSGGRPTIEGRPQVKLVRFSLNGESKTVVTAAKFGLIRPSPDKRLLVVFSQVAVRWPKIEELVPHLNDSIYQADLFDVQGQLIAPGLGGIEDVRPDSIRWAPNGKEIAFVGKQPGTAEAKVFLYNLARKSVEVVNAAAFNLIPAWDTSVELIWSGTSELVVRAKPKVSARKTDETDRWDWWSLKSNDVAKNLTAAMKSSPTQLIAESGGRTFMGLSEGHLWRIHLDGSTPLNLTEKVGAGFTSIAWPRLGSTEILLTSQLILASRLSPYSFFSVDLPSGRIEPLKHFREGARVLAYDKSNDVAVLRSEDRNGTLLSLLSLESDKTTALVETNTFLREIAEGETRKITYRSLDGAELDAWILLPPGYQPGNRYPLVTWVYAGLLQNDQPIMTSLQISHPLNLQHLAARGYVVLMPSIPLKPEDKPSDPYLDLTNGVLTAVDKVIEIGIADPKRLAVIGHSFGGYTTYGLVTQTNRFQVAVALAGMCDLVSSYGSLEPRLRYSSFPHEHHFNMSGMETAWGRMGNPPWKDWGRYLRNSPLFYVDRVETPLMIIQGDMDYVPMQQGEQFFNALYRQGKRAQFVRYWGEGHVLESPPNIRDMWHRTFAWLDEFLDVSRDEKGSLLWESDKVKSRNGAPALKPDDFARFDQILKAEPSAASSKATH
ncbi:MAG TPA: prolyl oligopeptidase family serine peptidase [Pyrinomonadaceae bacterium]|nr:prolyl oligopeptidase family serine peptidase [Pyrinomonadaceae bacterium]